MSPLQHYKIMLSACPRSRHFPLWFNECFSGIHGDVLARRAQIVGEYATRRMIGALLALVATERKAA